MVLRLRPWEDGRNLKSAGVDNRNEKEKDSLKLYIRAVSCPLPFHHLPQTDLMVDRATHPIKDQRFTLSREPQKLWSGGYPEQGRE